MMNSKRSITIGICDDDIVILEKSKLYINEINKILWPDQYDIRVTTFNSSVKLLSYLNESELDLVILDIELPEINGFELAQIIEEKFAGIELAFISSHDNYVFDSFDFDILRFIRKDNLQKDMAKTIKKYLQKYSDMYISLKLVDDYKKRNFLIKDIICFESYGHNVTMITRKGDFRLYYTLSYIEKITEKFCFIRIHRSYLINPFHMKAIRSNCVEMTNQAIYQIGKGKRHYVKNRIYDYDNYLV